MRRWVLVGLLAWAPGCLRCGAEAQQQQDEGPEASASAVYVRPPDDPDVVEARALVSKFLEPDANYQALTAELLPTEADYDAVFLPEAADRVHEIYAPRFDRGELVIRPAANQTEVLVFKATTEEIQAGQAPRFPGGYKNVASILQPGLTFYVFVFVEPGKLDGTTYDGLVKVKGRWTIFPKLWQAMR